MLEAADLPEALRPTAQTAEWAQSWWMPRHAAKLVEAKARSDVRVVMLGDSLTHEWERDYPAHWQATMAQLGTLNLGFSGDRTEHVLWRIQAGELNGLRPDWAVLLIGTNNASHRRDSPAVMQDAIQAILAQLNRRLPGARVVLMALPPRGPGAGDPMRIHHDAVNARLRTLADGRQIIWLDIGPQLLEAGGKAGPAYQADQLHLSAEGYRRWASVLLPLLAR